ncbi:hypothetical protein ACFFWD_19150 [Bradyrhizobium erythrophlei]|uniref:hypothetical protein n=1 Tax=Bradyrhizobium erythrophlei TaxID=1437360 RepID=UPI0035EFB461
MQQSESPQKPRGLVLVRKPDRNPTRAERLELWLSNGRTIDGLWVGSREAEPYTALRRVEDALQLIKRSDRLNHSRVTRNLGRIWVHLIPHALAHYSPPLNACALDERFVLQDTTTRERLASTIIHETTHARLAGWGIDYEEKKRASIEAICLRRELNFLKRFPSTAPLQEEITHTLEWYTATQDYFSEANFQERDEQGQIETLRYLDAPEWFVTIVMWFIRWRHRRAAASQER